MPTRQPELTPTQRRDLAASLLARVMMKLASKGLLAPAVRPEEQPSSVGEGRHE